ncbi:MAG: M48 family metallopeptidase [Thermodesulfobacteriota bacterium]
MDGSAVEKPNPPPSGGYAGGAFFHQDRTFGTLTVNASGLHYQSDPESISFPLRGLVLEAGGANDQTLFFTHPDFPDRTLFTTDTRILKDPAFTRNAGLEPMIRRIQSTRIRSRVILAGFLVILLGGFASLFLFKDSLVIAVADRIPARWEARLGQSALSQLKAGNEFIEDTAIRDQLMGITDPVFQGIPETEYDFRVYLARNPEINAFALPGGIIVLNSGLILSATGPDQVAGVLAHEAAHVTLRHGLRQIIGAVGLFALVQALFGDATGLMAVLIDNSALLLTRKYSRDYEREADETGWDYLTAAGIDPRGMISFFEHLIEETRTGENLPAGLGDALNFLSTHPATPERIDRLREKWAATKHQTGDFRSITIDFQDLQDRIRRLE